MRIERGKIEGDVEIREDLELHGMIAGSATVKDGARLDLNGTVTGDLVVEEGATVILRGTVAGDVTNRGGELAIYGMIDGRLIRVAGTTEVDPDAVIHGS
jgi:hypothetical protein